MSKKKKTSILTVVFILVAFALLFSSVTLAKKDKEDVVVNNTPRIELTDSNGKEFTEYIFNK